MKVEPAIIAIWSIRSGIGMEIPWIETALVQQWLRQKSEPKVRVFFLNPSEISWRRSHGSPIFIFILKTQYSYAVLVRGP